MRERGREREDNGIEEIEIREEGEGGRKGNDNGRKKEIEIREGGKGREKG